MRSIGITLITLALMQNVFAGASTFDDLGLGANTFHNSTPFSSGGAQFNNSFPDFGIGYWEGFSYSSKTDTTTAGSGNQYSAIAGQGAGGSSAYGVAFSGFVVPTITLPAGVDPISIDLTNTTYAYLSMRDGDMFSKKFGGASGNDPDFFKLTITGKDAGDSTIGAVDFYLADYRFANNAQDYRVNTWTTVDLSSLTGSRTLVFSFDSSDVGDFGINTPTYVAVDNVTFTPEPSVGMVIGLSVFAMSRRSKNRRYYSLAQYAERGR